MKLEKIKTLTDYLLRYGKDLTDRIVDRAAPLHVHDLTSPACSAGIYRSNSILHFLSASLPSQEKTIEWVALSEL